MVSPNPAGPLLSIVIPFYGVQDYLADALGSVRDQLLEDIEVVLVDDGSPDGSLAIAEQFAAADPRFRVVRQHNQGLGPARNTGVAHATGRYLAFMDSDDLVPPRGYRHLVASLERTGSDIAVGDVWRFTTLGGVRDSWLHRELFSTERPGIELTQMPELARDRMVWNKVFRRSSWDRWGLTFPAIRYEDYPVTLAAYLAASQIDVLPHRVYLWRDRESGDSITQQYHRLDNATDRFASATAVLDLLNGSSTTPAVRAEVESTLAQVDLPALAATMALAASHDQPAAAALSRELAERLPPSASSEHRYARAIHQSLRRDDPQLAAAVARTRLSGDRGGLLRYAARHHPQWLPSLADAFVDRQRWRSGRGPRRLRSRIQSAQNADAALQVDIAVSLRPQLMRTARVSVRLQGQPGTDPIPVRTVDVRAQPTGCVCTVHLPDSLLVQAPGGIYTLLVAVRVGPLLWAGSPTPLDRPPAARRIGATGWQQLGAIGDATAIRRVPVAVAITEVIATSDAFQLQVSGAPADHLTIERPWPASDERVSVQNGMARIEASRLIASDPADDPVSKVAERRLRSSSPVLLATTMSDSLHVDGASITVTSDREGAAILLRRPISDEDR